MDQFTNDFWSIVIILMIMGPALLWRASADIFSTLSDEARLICLYAAKFVIVYELTSCFAVDMGIALHPIFTALISISVLFLGLFAWGKIPLTTKQKRWAKIGLIILACVLLFVWIMHAFFDLNAIAVLRLLWRRFVLPIVIGVQQLFAWAMRWCRGLIRDVMKLTWKEGLFYARGFVGKVLIRWGKKIVFFLIMYQLVANRMRRIFLNEKVQLVKNALMAKKEKVVAVYKSLPFWQKLGLCVAATVIIFFVGEAWDFFYPILPKGFLIKVIGAFKFIGGLISKLLSKLGIQGLIDKLTFPFINLAKRLIPKKPRERIERKWHFFRHWRLPRYVLLFDRWIGVVNRELRAKERKKRQDAIDKMKGITKKATAVTGNLVGGVVTGTFKTAKTVLSKTTVVIKRKKEDETTDMFFDDAQREYDFSFVDKKITKKVIIVPDKRKKLGEMLSIHFKKEGKDVILQ